MVVTQPKRMMTTRVQLDDGDEGARKTNTRFHSMVPPQSLLPKVAALLLGGAVKFIGCFFREEGRLQQKHIATDLGPIPNMVNGPFSRKKQPTNLTMPPSKSAVT